MTTIQEVQKKKAKEKNRVLESGKKLLNVRDDIIDLFEKGIFPQKGIVFKTKEKKSEENNLEKIKDDYKIFFKCIEGESKDTDYNLFENYFSFQYLVLQQKNYLRQKIKKENNKLVELIKVKWSNLKDKIKILKNVEEIFEFNREKQLE